jgi:hypothetical protein
MTPKKVPPKGLPLFAPTTALIATQVNHIIKNHITNGSSITYSSINLFNPKQYIR